MDLQKISALFWRARDTVSDSKDLGKEKTRIVNVLMDNGYKKSTIMIESLRRVYGTAND